ncbi:Hypothetical predicted protein [Paramuricea clavata]|uniref:Uncharacterized protein n=1 Tax=Paramuricea clavata TaxID=317549 RepID=A0A7D9HF06_PARCT|nr:Hypothetical predicted protein [Paramuricea clavata]
MARSRRIFGKIPEDHGKISQDFWQDHGKILLDFGCCQAKWGKASQKNETSCKSVEGGPQKKRKVTDQFLLKLCGVESHEFHTAGEGPGLHEPIDPLIVKKMKEMEVTGAHSAVEVRLHLHTFMSCFGARIFHLNVTIQQMDGDI